MQERKKRGRGRPTNTKDSYQRKRKSSEKPKEPDAADRQRRKRELDKIVAWLEARTKILARFADQSPEHILMLFQKNTDTDYELYTPATGTSPLRQSLRTLLRGGKSKRYPVVVDHILRLMAETSRAANVLGNQ